VAYASLVTILIAGCGYLGKAAAVRLRRDGHRVIGLTRSAESAQALVAEGMEAQAGDIADAAFVESLPEAGAVLHCAASGRGGGAAQYRQVYVEGVRNFLAARPGARFVFTSSSSVYAQIDGSWVTEESPAVPDRETGRLLREAEELVLSASGTVLRLAGIYGPGRSVLLKNFLLGEAQIDVRTEPPATPDGRWINQIHREDAAAAVAWAVATGAAGVFNVADHTPMTQRTVYAELARRYQRPLPPAGPPALDRKRGWTHKRVSSRKLSAAGWSPQFPSWFDALDHDPLLVPSVLAQIADEVGSGLGGR
jgi:nucleoside-diphosphate-sugar epimerase